MRISQEQDYVSPESQQIRRRFGQLVRDLRLESRLSVSRVAEACTMPVEVYKEMEAGRYAIYLDELYELANALKTTPFELISQIEHKPTSR